jgi:uncharacterized secreted protein with C-terminal beta-propeller domain
MKILLLSTLTVGLLVSALLACATAPAMQIPPVTGQGPTAVKKTMQAFGSEQELARYLRKLAEKQKSRGRVNMAYDSAAATPAEPPASVAKSADAKSGKDEESVTNVQHAGVDEGGIVKLHGDHLVVLRRGRLFTVAIGEAL